MPDATRMTSALPSRAGLVIPEPEQAAAARFVSRHAHDRKRDLAATASDATAARRGADR